MKSFKLTAAAFAIAASLASTSITANAVESNSNRTESTSKLLTANFDPRTVVKVEAGDFHFTPGQVAPIHTHEAPAVGYVAKGSIIYQVEGEKPQILNAGDVFYEPAGPRILRFDNVSATEEVIFIDFNLQQQNEPFIVFEKELTEKIDRRTLPTTTLENQTIEEVDMFVSEIEPNGHKSFKHKNSILGYVAEGVVHLESKGGDKKRVVAGSTFSMVQASSAVIVSNASDELPAKVISFYLN